MPAFRKESRKEAVPRRGEGALIISRQASLECMNKIPVEEPRERAEGGFCSMTTHVGAKYTKATINRDEVLVLNS